MIVESTTREYHDGRISHEIAMSERHDDIINHKGVLAKFRQHPAST